MMKRVSASFACVCCVTLFAAILMTASLAFAQGAPPSQPAVIKPGDNLVVENIPAVPAAIAEKANQYGEVRSAGLQDWDPVKREMLIGTRFADVPEIHRVKMPGGDRTQLTFFPDRTGGGHFGPKGDYFTFTKDVGGGEWFQIYRYDLADGTVTLLTDGKSRNTGRSFANNDNRIAYGSTRRTGQERERRAGVVCARDVEERGHDVDVAELEIAHDQRLGELIEDDDDQRDAEPEGEARRAGT